MANLFIWMGAARSSRPWLQSLLWVARADFIILAAASDDTSQTNT